MSPKPRLAMPWTIGLAAFSYFVLFPEDLATLLAPIRELLGLSNAVSPWLYVLLGGGCIAWTIRRIWDPRRRVSGD